MTTLIFQPKENPDDLYESFDKSLYRLTGSEQEDDIMQQLSADHNADNSQNVTVSASDLGSGVDTSTTISATGSYQAGKKVFDNTATGFILGVDPSDGKSKFYIGDTTNYFNYNGTTVSIVGDTNASISITQSTGATFNMLFNSSGLTFKVGSTVNATIGLTAGSTPFSAGNLSIQVGDTLSVAVVADLHWVSSQTGDWSPTNNSQHLDLGTSSSRWTTIYLVNAPNVSSDVRLKSGIRDSEYGLNEVLRMEPIQYRRDRREHLGFSAQAMERIVPEVVLRDAGGFYSMSYEGLVPVLVRAVQELSAEVDSLRSQLLG